MKNIYTNKNIYIINEEEIKSKDWVLNIETKELYKANEEDIISFEMNKGDSIEDYLTFNFKIILTTDEDLIKDGVQAIDDQFLEWFVKNPKCDFVDLGFMSNITSGNRLLDLQHRQYKIIIPQEETTCQSERMFTNDEVLELLLNRPGPYLTDDEIKEWFEKFKKK